MKYEGNARYQFQPRHVKAMRWLRYMPLGWIKASLSIASWLATGAQISEPFTNRREVAAHIIMCHRSMAAMNMGAYSSVQEVIAKLRGESAKESAK